MVLTLRSTILCFVFVFYTVVARFGIIPSNKYARLHFSCLVTPYSEPELVLLLYLNEQIGCKSNSVFTFCVLRIPESPCMES